MRARPFDSTTATLGGTAVGYALQRLYPATTAKGRALRLAALTAGVTGSYVGYMIQRAFLGEEARGRKRRATHASAGRRIREELQTLRGPIMKFGQALSLHTDILPEGVLEELTKLQMEAPGMHPSLARAQFKASLGRDPDEVFTRFEDAPFAAASLGQVHRATLPGGRTAAVKIQYPGIRAAIENDFRWIRGVAAPATLSGHVPKGVLDEMESQVLAETDYVREADNVDFFKAALKPLPFVHVPKVYRRFSSDRVLTLSVVHGRHMDAFLAAKPGQGVRDRLGRRLLELFTFQVLSMRVLHADPHWGNYLFNEDGTIGLVDFGCVKRFDRRLVDSLRKGMLFPGDFRGPEFQQIVQEQFGGPRTIVSRATRRAVVDFAERFYRKVFPPDATDESQVFDFGDAAFLREFMQASARLTRAKGTLPHFVFYARAEVGLYMTLHRLRARVPTSAIVRRVLDATHAPDPGER